MENTLEDDGLITPDVGPWSLQKYRLIDHYTHMFTTGMKSKWECRVYIDLFAGSGRSRIRGSDKIVPASPMIALSARDPFDKYIFCELKPENMESLRTRVYREWPQVDASFVLGDANMNIRAILNLIPSSSRNFRVLTFCFVDPYKVANLDFTTIKSLALQRIDFLVLIPTYMDAHRNQIFYTAQYINKVDRFLGNPNWRNEWNEAEQSGKSFGRFFVESFGLQMESLGYLNNIHETVLVHGHRNRPLYHLAYFSKSERGMDFWRKARKGADPQRSLFDT